MPVLKSNEDIQRVYLPSTKGAPEAEQAFVDIDVSPLKAGDVIGVDTSKSDIEAGIAMLAQRIKGWNFTDASGAELPVTEDNVKKLDMADFAFLGGKVNQDIGGLTTDEKKA